jgi:hypothetical protein
MTLPRYIGRNIGRTVYDANQQVKKIPAGLNNMYMTSILKPQIDYVKSLPPNIRNAISKYEDDYDWRVNGYLLKGPHEDVEHRLLIKQIDREEFNTNDLDYGYDFTLGKDVTNIQRHLDVAFQNAPPTTRDITLYRGIRYNKGNKYKHDSVFNKQYISVTTDKLVAIRYKADCYCCVMHIHIPKGSRIIPIYKMALYKDQFEVILPRNGEFRINKQVGSNVYATFYENKQFYNSIKPVKLDQEVYKKLKVVFYTTMDLDDFHLNLDPITSVSYFKNRIEIGLNVSDEIYKPNKLLYKNFLKQMSKKAPSSLLIYTITTNKTKYTLYIKNGNFYKTRPK